MRKCVINVVGAAAGTTTPHDGRYVVTWDPHTKFGILAMTSTADRTKATVFDFEDAFEQWRAVSKVDPVRYDGKPNRPLTAVSVSFETA